METLEELKAIIDNAPEGATHRTKHCYIKIENCTDWSWHYKNEWELISGSSDISEFEDYRSLSDIKRIIELMEIVEDAAALGFLTPSFDSGISHKQLCKKYDALK